MQKENDWEYVGICDAGVYGGKINCNITTYDTRLERYFCRLKDGGIVLDKRECFKNNQIDTITEIVNGPTLNLEMNPDECEEGFLAYAGKNVYINRWRKIGARIGKREGNIINWEDGEKEEIVEYN